MPDPREQKTEHRSSSAEHADLVQRARESLEHYTRELIALMQHCSPDERIIIEQAMRENSLTEQELRKTIEFLDATGKTVSRRVDTVLTQFIRARQEYDERLYGKKGQVQVNVGNVETRVDNSGANLGIKVEKADYTNAMAGAHIGPHIEGTGGIDINVAGGGGGGNGGSSREPASPSSSAPHAQPQPQPAAQPVQPAVAQPSAPEVAPVVPPPAETPPPQEPAPAPQREVNFLRSLNMAKRQETLEGRLDGIARNEDEVKRDLEKVKYAETAVVKADTDLNQKIDNFMVKIAGAKEKIDNVPAAELTALAEHLGLPVEKIKEIAEAQFIKMNEEAEQNIKSQTSKGALKKAIATQTVLYGTVATLGIIGFLPATLVGVGVGAARLGVEIFRRRKEKKKIEAEKNRLAVDMVQQGKDEHNRYKEALHSALANAKQEQIDRFSFEQVVEKMDEHRAAYLRDYRAGKSWEAAPGAQEGARVACLAHITEARRRYEQRILRHLADDPYWGKAEITDEERKLYANACGSIFLRDERDALSEAELAAEFESTNPSLFAQAREKLNKQFGWFAEAKQYPGIRKRQNSQIATGLIMLGGRLIAHSNSVVGVAMDAYGGWRLGGGISDFFMRKKYGELQHVSLDDIKRCEGVADLPPEVAQKLNAPDPAAHDAWLAELRGKARQQVMDPRFKEAYPAEYLQLKEYLRTQDLKEHAMRNIERLRKARDDAERGVALTLGLVSDAAKEEAQVTREKVIEQRDVARTSRQRQRELTDTTRTVRVTAKVGGALMGIVLGEMMAGRVSEVLGREMKPESPILGVDALHRGGSKIPHIIPEGVTKAAAAFVANVQEHTKDMAGHRWWEHLSGDFWKENIDWMKKFVPELELEKAVPVIPHVDDEVVTSLPRSSAPPPKRIPEVDDELPYTGPRPSTIPRTTSPLPSVSDAPPASTPPPPTEFLEITKGRNSITAAVAEMLQNHGMGHAEALAHAGDMALQHGDIHVFDPGSGKELPIADVVKLREGGMSWKQIYGHYKIEETWEMKVGGKIYLTGDKEHGWDYQEQHGSEPIHAGGTVETDKGWEKLHTRLPKAEEVADATRGGGGTAAISTASEVAHEPTLWDEVTRKVTDAKSLPEVFKALPSINYEEGNAHIIQMLEAKVQSLGYGNMHVRDIILSPQHDTIIGLRCNVEGVDFYFNDTMAPLNPQKVADMVETASKLGHFLQAHTELHVSGELVVAADGSMQGAVLQLPDGKQTVPLFFDEHMRVVAPTGKGLPPEVRGALLGKDITSPQVLKDFGAVWTREVQMANTMQQLIANCAHPQFENINQATDKLYAFLKDHPDAWRYLDASTAAGLAARHPDMMGVFDQVQARGNTTVPEVVPSPHVRGMEATPLPKVVEVPKGAEVYFDQPAGSDNIIVDSKGIHAPPGSQVRLLPWQGGELRVIATPQGAAKIFMSGLPGRGDQYNALAMMYYQASPGDKSGPIGQALLERLKEMDPILRGESVPAGDGAIREIAPGVHVYDPNKGPFTSKEFFSEVFGGDTAGTTRHELMVDGQKLMLKVDNEGKFIGFGTDGRDISYVSDTQMKEMLGADYRARIALAHPELSGSALDEMAEKAELTARGVYDDVKLYKAAVAAGDQRLAHALRGTILEDLQRSADYHGQGVLNAQEIRAELGLKDAGVASESLDASHQIGRVSLLEQFKPESYDDVSTQYNQYLHGLLAHADANRIAADLAKSMSNPPANLSELVQAGLDRMKEMDLVGYLEALGNTSVLQDINIRDVSLLDKTLELFEADKSNENVKILREFINDLRASRNI